MSPELIAFLRDWRAWVDRGAPEGEPYTRVHGLCGCANHCGGLSLRYEMSDCFSDSYPFGMDAFHARSRASTQHEDPARLAWVDAALAEQPA